MKENVSGYSRNPCSLNRERDTAFAAKLLTLPTGFFSAEKSEEWMARSPVWPDDVIASETASRHQPMNWRDSIWVQDSVTRRRSQSVLKATQCLVPYSENKGYASNPRRFLDSFFLTGPFIRRVLLGINVVVKWIPARVPCDYEPKNNIKLNQSLYECIWFCSRGITSSIIISKLKQLLF